MYLLNLFGNFFLESLNPNPDAIRKCIAVRLGVIYDSQGANWKQGGLPMRDPLPTTLLLAVEESYMTPNRPKYTKIPPESDGSSYFLIEKSYKTAFV
jgi:hypothetical protein